MTDAEIAERVRRLDRARHGQHGNDMEAWTMWESLRTEYWGPGDGLDWLLGETE